MQQQCKTSTFRLLNQSNTLMYQPVRNFRRNAAPGYYNMRFRPSQGNDNVYFHNWANIHGANPETGVSKIYGLTIVTNTYAFSMCATISILIMYSNLIIVIAQNPKRSFKVRLQ